MTTDTPKFPRGDAPGDTPDDASGATPDASNGPVTDPRATPLPVEMSAASQQLAALAETVEKRKKKGRKKGKKKGAGSDRGIETMFRTSYRTHVDLSGLADNKANIMISINGIMISILLASISPKIDSNPWLMLPTAVLLVGTLSSLIYAILAARPRVTSHVVSLDDVRSDSSNILFFGNFISLSEDDYVVGMRELMDDNERLYGNMIRDIYALGQVLALKFRLLRTSYNIFMGGLVAGVALFLVVIVQVSFSGSGIGIP